MLFQYFLIYLEQFNLVFAYWCLTTFASKKKKKKIYALFLVLP